MKTYKEFLIKLKDYQNVLVMLENAINSEMNALLMYLSSYGSCKNDLIKKEYNEHALEEYEHAQKFYKILQDLGGNYQFFDVSNLVTNSDCQIIPNLGSSIDRIRDNIKAEFCAISSYRNLLINYDFSEEHKKIIEEIISDEEKHVKDLQSLEKKVLKEL